MNSMLEVKLYVNRQVSSFLKLMFIGVPQNLFNYLHILLVIRSIRTPKTNIPGFSYLLLHFLSIYSVSSTVCSIVIKHVLK